ncbi:MAG: PrsW family intramembrane metalloprotease [Patescibacteria group bacterium]
MPTWAIITLAVLLALLPVVAWYRILLREEAVTKRVLFWIFVGGSLSVVPIFFIQFLWGKFPRFNPFLLIESSVTNVAEAAILTFIVVGVMEEVVKHLVVRYTDSRHPEYIETLRHALVFSIVSALGFAFAENIFYFRQIYIVYGVGDLVTSFIFRSIFTAMGHMTFSAVFGYYFGIAKFAESITEHAKWSGKSMPITRMFGKIFGWKTYEVYRQRKILEGLFLAMGLHAIFNFLLEMGQVLPVILLILASATFVYYLIKHTTGNLLFSFTARRESTMATRDEDVVIELLGMWSNEGRLKEVIDICDRLLLRDPDNNVVKIFKAKAQDNQKLRAAYEKLKEVFKKTDITTGTQSVAGIKTSQGSAIKADDEKIIAEVMQTWYKDEKYSQVIDVAKRLLEKNPNSSGAKVILEKAFSKQKAEELFSSLKKLFE